MRDAFEDAKILAQPQGIQVQLEVCEALTVMGDRHRLRQLLLNLTDNAIKYNQPGGQVRLALRQNQQMCELTIRNTGPGIHRELQPRVFERFFRGVASPAQDIEGCGLGLSIAQWIVTAHRGSIHLDSEPDRETVLLIQLPSA
jgi:signal transduction histidine kinase